MSEKLIVENILPMSNVGGEKARGQPDVLLNLDSFSTLVEKRSGRTLLASLTNSHSLQEVDGYFLAGAEGSIFGRALWLIDLAGDTTELAELPDFNRLYYVPIGDKIYVSSKTKSFIFNKITRQVEAWGIALPEVGPDVTVIGGGLPPGKYSLTFTREVRGELSGSGPVTEVELTITGGISISNVASDFLVWITEPNGTKFLFSGIASEIQKPVGAEILQTLDVTPPDGLEHLIFFRGRLWGTKDDKIFYSDSYAFNWFRPYNLFTFKGTILMLAHDSNGVYIGTKDNTWFQSGDNIRQMSLKEIGGGVIKGALVYAPVGPDDIRVPVWASPEAIFAGVNGLAVSLTDEKVDIQLGDEGAAFFRKIKGKLQIGVNAPSSGAGISDKVTVNVFRQGRLINATYFEAVRDHLSMADSPSPYLINEGFDPDPGWAEVGDSSVVNGEVVSNSVLGADAHSSITFSIQPEIWIVAEVTFDSFSFSPGDTSGIVIINGNGISFRFRLIDSGGIKFQTIYLQDSGDVTGTPITSVLPATGQKYTITLHLKKEITPSSQDGIIELWIDSLKVLDNQAAENNGVDPDEIFVGGLFASAGASVVQRTDNVKIATIKSLITTLN